MNRWVTAFLTATLGGACNSASRRAAVNPGHDGAKPGAAARVAFKVTERHYAQGSAVGNAATARVLGRLASEMGGQPSAGEQLEQLDEGTLARLLELLAQSKKGGTPAS